MENQAMLYNFKTIFHYSKWNSGIQIGSIDDGIKIYRINSNACILHLDVIANPLFVCVVIVDATYGINNCMQKKPNTDTSYLQNVCLSKGQTCLAIFLI
jgi:hypothetical protein